MNSSIEYHVLRVIEQRYRQTAAAVAEIRASASALDTFDSLATSAGFYQERPERDSWKVQYPTISIDRSQLPALRAIVGRMTVYSKCALEGAENYGKIQVTLQPVSKDFAPLKFQYTTELRAGAKCHVVETTSTYRTLVCDR